MSKYELPYLSKWGAGTVVTVGIITLIFMEIWRRGGMMTPEAHTHNGVMTVAGWIHGAYMVWVISVSVLFFLAPIAPAASVRDTLIAAIPLTVLLVMGIVKFNPRWTLSLGAAIQTLSIVAVLWAAVGVKLLHK
jgi:hypothetical protein